MSTKLEQARAEAAEHRATFLRLHKECCDVFGKYCQAMERAQELTSATAVHMLGGLPENENKLAALLIKEPPIKAIKREGFEPVWGWGWDLRLDVVPLVKKTCAVIA